MHYSNLLHGYTLKAGIFIPAFLWPGRREGGMKESSTSPLPGKNKSPDIYQGIQ